MSKDLIISDSLTKELSIVTELKAQIDLTGTQCLQIKVIDDGTLSVAQQNLSKATQMVNFIEDKRVIIKARPFAECKFIDATCKDMSDQLTKGVTHLKTEVKNWEEAKRKAEAEKQAEIERNLAAEQAKIKAESGRKQAIRDYLNNTAIPALKRLYDNCIDSDSCEKALKNIDGKFKPREYFEEFAGEAYTMKDNYIQMIESKKANFFTHETLSDVDQQMNKDKEDLARQKADLAAREANIKAAEDKIKADKEAKELEVSAQIERDRLANEALLSKTKNIRYTWKFELVDKTQLKPEWTTLNEGAVKEWLKEKKTLLVDGEIVNGVKFKKEISVMS